MGDDDRRAVAHQRVERAAHLRLADRVEMRGRLVEDQGRRVLQKGAGDRDALALAAGQLHAALADPGVEPLGQARDEIGERRLIERAVDRRLVGVGPGERDIGAQRVVEQIGVLRDQRDAAAQMVELEIAQIDAVDQDVPGAGSQKRSSRLASVVLPAPDGPDDRDRRAGRNVERRRRSSAGRRAPG